MNSTKLSPKGQIIIPKALRTAHHWEAGQELMFIDVGDGVLIKPQTPFKETGINDVAACLKAPGKKAKDFLAMDSHVEKGLKEKTK